MRERTRTIYRLLLAAVGVSLGAFTWWLLASGDRGATVATVLGFPVAILALAIAVLGVPWQKKPSDHAGLVAAARALARDVGTREAAEQQKFLADTGDSHPADVAFSQPQLVFWRTDGGTRQGSLKTIKPFYSELHRGRLVILGQAGAGKTVLANHLLLNIIDALALVDPPSGQTITVPVRFSLPDFDPGDDRQYIQPGALRSRLDSWIAQTLTEVYGLNSRTARDLLQNDYILPVLDGLDEMDSGGGNPTHAAAVVRALNYPVGGRLRPAVITCRTDRYQQLIGADFAAGEILVLQDATAIHVRPLTSDQVAAYLTHRFPDPENPASIQQRWQFVLDFIIRQPKGQLAGTLASPLYLYLAITAYHSPVTDPTELLCLPESESIAHHLLTQLIPAAVSQHPRSDGRKYDPADVVRWLTNLATHLKACRTHEGGQGSDINLYELWTIGGYRAPRYLGAVLHGLLTAFPLLLLATWLAYQTRELIQPFFINQLLYGVAVLLVSVTIWRASRPVVSVKRLNFTIPHTFAARRRFVTFFLIGLMYGVAIGLVLGFAYALSGRLVDKAGGGLTFGLTFGLGGGLVFGLLRGVAHKPGAIGRPRELVTQGLTYDLTMPLGLGLGLGLANGAACLAIELFGSPFPFQSQLGPNPESLTAIAGSWSLAGVCWGLAVGGLIVSDSPWPRYLVATRILAHHRQLPPALGLFLDWAYTAGLLRLSGISTQFRHRELQDHLATSTLPEGPTASFGTSPESIF